MNGVNDAIISLESVTKNYVWQKKRKGVLSPFLNTFAPQYETTRALRGIDLGIKRNEVVALLGPNGAGKSTTIKLITGILQPTSGSISVMQMIPQRERKKLVKNVGVVFGQKVQLWWNLPVIRSYEILKAIYDIDDSTYNRNLDTYGRLLGIHDLLDQPVRQLSLGQRMRAEFVSALLHNPSILLLDEPTIGLDIIARECITDFIANVQSYMDTTVLLTTHDVHDIARSCSRLVIINNGQIVKDSAMEEIRVQLYNYVVLKVRFKGEVTLQQLDFDNVSAKQQDARNTWFFIDRRTSDPLRLLQKITARSEVDGYELSNQGVEDIIRQYYVM